jgi:hypothetical protein
MSECESGDTDNVCVASEQFPDYAAILLITDKDVILLCAQLDMRFIDGSRKAARERTIFLSRSSCVENEVFPL